VLTRRVLAPTLNNRAPRLNATSERVDDPREGGAMPIGLRPTTTGSRGTFVAGNPVAGIAMEGDNHNELSRNRVRRNGDGIIVGGDGNTITRNQVADAVGCPENGGIGCDFGISLEAGSHNLVAGNNVARARRVDIRLDAFEGMASGNVFRANIVRAAGVDGIAINFVGYRS
jgi:parallel beta-helix repeat protein